ncbi:MAG: 30S ribosomal protein S20 [Deltaproteobacteria bacterium RIFCSPLOWO2_02_FULL_50_16]|nr:MAG: 30S ribosomal protein S20 [Deltaproteobacteria bacterium RIFCSPHIGHO2_02_FULL_50_15]OGQ57775.1 MAG: 30S ribosomal protein S20 [Deltaproteobacteria bacterium RIFCSPLOWO2_02_FULL_50_16]
MAEAPIKKKKLVKGRHLSAIKRQRQEIKRTAFNVSRKSAIRTSTKNVLAAIQKNDKKSAIEALKTVSSLLQKASRHRRLHPKTASRKIGRLSRKVAALGR